MPNLPAFILEPRFTTEEITKKWVDIGLLEGLTDDNKTLVAGYFEEATAHILATDSWNQDLRLQLILPTIRRFMFDHDSLNIKDVQEKFDYFFENEMRDQVEEYEAQGLDVQAESVENFCSDYDHYDAHFKGKLKKLKQLKY
jgi:hypothetical protein